MVFDIVERCKSYLGPCQPLSYAFYCQWKALRSGNNLNISFRDYAFATWYKESEQHMIACEATTAVPALVSSASGVVLELGPGSGNQLARYTPANIEHIYGIEPNAAFFGTLQARIQETGLQDKYTILLGEAENERDKLFADHGIVADSLDCVVSMQVLCSVRDAPALVQTLWRLLKPGGTLIFWEHNESRDWLTRRIQKLWNLLWPWAIGGCRLDCPTMHTLLQNGDWEVLEMGRDDLPWAMLPRVWGRLGKVAQGQGVRRDD